MEVYVLCDTFASVVHKAEAVLGFGITLLRKGTKLPLRRRVVVTVIRRIALVPPRLGGREQADDDDGEDEVTGQCFGRGVRPISRCPQRRFRGA
jgi:hypothetical protein